MFRYLTIFLAVIALFLPIFLLAQAQTTQIILTWQADSYTESAYRGKILPAPGSLVTAAAQLIDGDKPVSLAPYRVSWFLDNRFLERGNGLDSIKFNASAIMPGGSHRLKIVVLDYKGADLQKIITIPIARPEVVIRNPYRNGVMPGKYQFSALFYNWNIRNLDNLLINWSAPGRTPISGEDKVEIEIPINFSGQSVAIGVAAVNPANDYEQANAKVNILIK